MIDIVVTYLNDEDISWQQDFQKYKQEEIEKGIVSSNNRQAFGKERTRNWNNMQYWFRGIEKNLSWINKVFFIVQKESQVPSWLNTDNKKIQIVYHRDYIPTELLPTFNTMTIQAFIPLIKDLSEQYVYLDDDTFFINQISQDFFFNGRGIPKHKDSAFWGKGSYAEELGPWGGGLDNSFKIEQKYGKLNYKYAPYHLPNPQLKSINQKVLKENWDEIYNGLKVSRFRHASTNVSPIELYTNVTKRLEKCIIDNNMFKNSFYVELKKGIVFERFLNADIVCFNDTENTQDFIDIKRDFLHFLNLKFPNKSIFEKGED